MPVTLVVLASGIAFAIVVWALTRASDRSDPVDPDAEERWLLRRLGADGRLAGLARRVDRRAAGALMLVVSFGIVLATALPVGLLFDMVQRDQGFARWDRSVAEWGSEHATDTSTDVLSWVTDLGGTLYLTAIAVVIGVVDYVRRRNAQVFLFLLVTIGGVALVNNILKWIVDRERPDVTHLVGAAGSSFPSGHSAAAAAAWCAFALVIGRRWSRRGRAVAGAGAAVIAGIVAASRALLGVHWLTDVMAGLVVGWGWFVLCALAFGGRLQVLGEPAERARDGSPERESPLTTSPP